MTDNTGTSLEAQTMLYLSEHGWDYSDHEAALAAVRHVIGTESLLRASPAVVTVSDEMVERGAKRLSVAHGDEWIYDSDHADSDTAKTLRQEYLIQARRVLEAALSACVLPGGFAEKSAAEETELTEEQLVALMRDPRYWKKRDPEILAKVTDGFKRLYPEPKE